MIWNIKCSGSGYVTALGQAFLISKTWGRIWSSQTIPSQHILIALEAQKHTETNQKGMSLLFNDEAVMHQLSLWQKQTFPSLVKIAKQLPQKT